MNKEKKRAYNSAYHAAHREEIIARHKARYANCREQEQAKMWARDIRAKYGLGVEDYNARLMGQGGVCKVCGAGEPGAGRKHFCVDHDHGTGEVRGLLCNACNKLIGFAREDRTILGSADLYLRGIT